MNNIRAGKLKHTIGTIAKGAFLKMDADNCRYVSQHFNFISKFSPISCSKKIFMSDFVVDSSDLEPIKSMESPLFTFSTLRKLFEKNPNAHSKELAIIHAAIDNYRNNDNGKVFSYIKQPIKDEVKLAYNLSFLVAGTELQRVSKETYKVIPVFEDLRTDNLDKIRICAKYLERNTELLEGYERFSKDGLDDIDSLPMAGLVRKLKFLTLENEEVKSHIVQLEGFYEKTL